MFNLLKISHHRDTSPVGSEFHRPVLELTLNLKKIQNGMYKCRNVAKKIEDFLNLNPLIKINPSQTLHLDKLETNLKSRSDILKGVFERIDKSDYQQLLKLNKMALSSLSEMISVYDYFTNHLTPYQKYSSDYHKYFDKIQSRAASIRELLRNSSEKNLLHFQDQNIDEDLRIINNILEKDLYNFQIETNKSAALVNKSKKLLMGKIIFDIARDQLLLIKKVCNCILSATTNIEKSKDWERSILSRFLGTESISFDKDLKTQVIFLNKNKGVFCNLHIHYFYLMSSFKEFLISYQNFCAFFCRTINKSDESVRKDNEFLEQNKEILKDKYLFQFNLILREYDNLIATSNIHNLRSS